MIHNQQQQQHQISDSREPQKAFYNSHKIPYLKKYDVFFERNELAQQPAAQVGQKKSCVLLLFIQ